MARRYAQLLNKTSDVGLDAVAGAMLDLLPASARATKRIDGRRVDGLLPGKTTVEAHVEWVHDMLRQMERTGLSDAGALEALRDLVSAIHRVPRLGETGTRTMIAELPGWPLADLRLLRRLQQAVGGGTGNAGKAAEARGYIQWLLHKQFLPSDPGHLDIGALRRHIPAFGEPLDAKRIAAFREQYAAARKRRSSGKAGQNFEKTVLAFGRWRPRYDLNDVNTKDLKKVSDGWRFNGRNYGPAKNFDLYDHLVQGPQGRVLLASVADGGFSYLIGKFQRLFRHAQPQEMKHVTQFDRVVEELRFLAKADPPTRVSGLSFLKDLPQDKAALEVARRSVLIVHPTSVEPLRAVLASRSDFSRMLGRFREATGTEASAQDLLARVQPGFVL